MPYALRKYKFRVTHIVDGDTIKGVFLIPRWWAWRPAEVEDKIRLVGMNTPETKGKEQEAGERAKSVVFSLLDGKTITVQIALRAHSHDWMRGDFNRVLGLVFMPHSRSMTVNEFLLREGHARLYAFPEWMPKSLASRFKKAEQKAKEKKKGIWKQQRQKQRTRGGISRWFWWLCTIIAWLCAIVVFFA